MEVTITPEEQAEFDMIADAVQEEIMPLIYEMEDECVHGSAIYDVFMSCVCNLLSMGWTPEELSRDIEAHHDHHMESERGSSPLQ